MISKVTFSTFNSKLIYPVFIILLSVTARLLLLYDPRPEVPKEVADMIAKGQYGINFIDKDKVIQEDPADLETSCSGFLKLKTLNDVDQIPYGVIMVETSGRKTLFPRQACALESAVRRSGLPVHLFVLASELDLSDNTTCQVARGGVTSQVNIFALDPDTFSVDTPLEGFFSPESLLANGPHRVFHTSDALRYLLLYKFGGFYLDLDYLVLNDLSHYTTSVLEEVVHTPFNMIVSNIFSDQVADFVDRWMGSILTGSAMSFPRHHPFVKMLLVSAVQAYSEPETYAILGPSHMTSVAKTFTGVENVLDITPDMGLNVIRQNHLSGVAAHRTPHLFNSPRSRDGWKYLLREASSIHFTAGYTSKAFPKIDRDDPESSAYSLLAPYLCPVALTSNEYF